MKKVLLRGVLLTFFLFGVLSINVNAKEAYYVNKNGIDMSELQYNKFLELFSKRKIEFLSLEEFNMYKDANILSGETIYQKVTYDNGKVVEEEIISEEEYEAVKDAEINSYANDDDCYETSYKRLSGTITDVNGTFYLMSALSWKKVPYARSYDVYAFRLNHFSYSGFMGNQVYIKGNDAYSIDYNTSSAGYKGFSNGAGVSMNLKDDSDITGFELTINSRLKFNTSSYSQAHVYISYQHAQNDLSRAQSMGYSLDVNGLGNVLLFSNATVRSTYDGMQGVHVSSPIY